MRRIRYAVATSLDGYVAGPNGETDWIIMDPEIDFGVIFRQFDTILLGAGLPLFPGPSNRIDLTLSGHKVYPKTGIVSLEYSIR